MVNKKNSTKKSNSSKIYRVKQRTREGVDKIIDTAESMSEEGKNKIESLKEKAQMMRNDVDDYIKKNPEKSVLVAVGIGLVAGAIIAAAMIRRR